MGGKEKLLCLKLQIIKHQEQTLSIPPLQAKEVVAVLLIKLASSNLLNQNCIFNQDLKDKKKKNVTRV